MVVVCVCTCMLPSGAQSREWPFVIDMRNWGCGTGGCPQPALAGQRKKYKFGWLAAMAEQAPSSGGV
jgi:hypothetical protein